MHLKILCAAVLAATVAAVNAWDVSFESYPVDGWAYFAEVTEEAVARAPQWDGDSENPPLSARKALRLADAYVDKEFEPRSDGDVRLRRELRSVSLVPHGERWVWLVRYEWSPTEGGVSGRLWDLAVPVLMDGTVVPVVRGKDRMKHPVGTGFF